MKYRVKNGNSSTSNHAALLLITVFGVSVSLGLTAAHVEPGPNVIHQKSPAPVRRQPDSETRPLPQSNPTPSAPPATASDGSEVVVAVIDTGADMTHPDLASHGWINSGETGIDLQGNDKQTNGIDDDGNGYIDDVNGYDFAERKGVVVDRHGHGTHIAGIILKGAPRAKIMNLKYYNRGLDGNSALRNSLEAMRYAIAMKADVINYSGGGTIPNPEELIILRAASRQGILIVAAAGNESSNSERQPFYPANYRLSNILSVTAIDDIRGSVEMLSTSNFGIRSVAVAAQGKDVLSTLPGGRYGRMTGTSQATAFATAASVRILEQRNLDRRSIPPEEVIERLVSSSSQSSVLTGKTRLGSKLSVDRAVKFRGDSSAGGRKTEELVHAIEFELDVKSRSKNSGLAELAAQ